MASDAGPDRSPEPPLQHLLVAFGSAASVDGWAAIDDRVMGGVSRSRLRFEATGYAVFEGAVSLERGGGFASVRSAPGAYGRAGDAATSSATATDLAADLDVLIEARGDGTQFKLCLYTDDGFDSLSYQASWTPAAGVWSTARLPLSDFRASFRGREVPSAPPLDASRIRQLGLMVAARQAGPFRLELRAIWLASRAAA
jgi:hypothetical protein